MGLEAYRDEALRPQLERRMAVVGLSSLEAYLELLARSTHELDRLLDTLLIGSTSFFRDPKAFEALHAQLPHVLGEATLRGWVAGCSTGEEAYSLAIVLLEHAEQSGLAPGSVRVFATDLRSRCVEVARRGEYPTSALATLPQRLREKYFVYEAKSFKVRRILRDAVCFGQHDLLTDPPFGRLHVISCRNVLLYLRSSAQQYVLQRLHFGLLPQGILFLGLAESPAAAPGLFRAKDREHRLYGKLVSAPSASLAR